MWVCITKCLTPTLAITKYSPRYSHIRAAAHQHYGWQVGRRRQWKVQDIYLACHAGFIQVALCFWVAAAQSLKSDSMGNRLTVEGKPDCTSSVSIT